MRITPAGTGSVLLLAGPVGVFVLGRLVGVIVLGQLVRVVIFGVEVLVVGILSVGPLGTVVLIIQPVVVIRGAIRAVVVTAAGGVSGICRNAERR